MESETQPLSNITPFLVAALICDVAAIEPNTGKKNLVGIFDRIYVRQFPTQRRFSLYLKLTDAEGRYEIEIEFVFVNTGEILRTAQGAMFARERTLSNDLTLDFPPIIFPQAGRYEFRIKMNNMFLGNAFIDCIPQPSPQ